MTYQQWLEFAKQQLAQVANDPYLNPSFDANWLLQWVLKQSSAYIYTHQEQLLSSSQQAELERLLERRCKGEPMAYILGETDFWTLSLKVSPYTLIPRPDTEILVENALNIAKQHIAQLSVGQRYRILDLGTGTGAIILALASELRSWAQKKGVILDCIGVDFIPQAVELAEQNAITNQLTEVKFLQSDWFVTLSQQNHHPFDLIVSNPPYIDEKDPHLAEGDVRFEPLTALVADDEGYRDLQLIIEHSRDYLTPKGWLIVEHGWQQGQKVRGIFQRFFYQQVETLKDYGGNERITKGQAN